MNVINGESNPVVNILNSNSITFNNLQYKPGAELLFNINVNRSSSIAVLNTNVSASVKKAEFNQDAKSQSLIIK